MTFFSRSLFLSFLFLYTAIAHAVPHIEPERDKGVYQLGMPERGKAQMNLGFGQMGNKEVMAVSACKQGCPVAVYSYLPEESKTLNVPVYFTTAGLYVIRYDAESFIIVQPDALLGRKVWQKIGHANIYSKNPTKAKQVSRADIEAYALKLSNQIMNQATGKMAHGEGTYFLAAPKTHLGKPQTQYQIEFENGQKKALVITPCDKCPTNRYDIQPEESAIMGTDVYRYASSDYLFDFKDGVLVHTFSNASGLGRVDWTKHSKFNVLSNNKAYIRQVLNSQQKQKDIDAQLAHYFSEVKTELRRRADAKQAAKDALRELPKAGLSDAALTQKALVAAQDWAAAWGWKETLKQAYFTSRDWAVKQHVLTGITTGRVINGVVTMAHPDGRCRFQTMVFRQDYDGSKYFNFHTVGIGVIEDIACDKLP